MFEGAGFPQAPPPVDLSLANAAGAAPNLDPEQLAAQWSAWSNYAAGYNLQMAAAYGLYGAYGSTGLTSGASEGSTLQSFQEASATSDLVDRFIAENNLDDSAGRLLRSEKPEVQAAVVGRGSLADCRNPSSAVMGRIRDAKVSVDNASSGAGASESTSGGSGLAGGSLVDRFISDNRLDDTAARLLRCETPEIQSAVVERGSLVDCRNPSSAVMGRIRDAKLAARNGQLTATSAVASGQGVMDTSDVDRFIVQNRLDTGAARSLKEEAPDIQRSVMDRGPVADCSNPSAAIMGRINEAKVSRGSFGDSLPSSDFGLGPDLNSATAFGAAMSPLAAAQFGLGGLVPGFGQMPPLMQQPFDPASGMPASLLQPPMGMLSPDLLPGTSMASFPVAPADDMDLEHFIQQGRIDSSAEKALRGESREIQMAVMMKGGLENCVNPSSAVMGRINEARQLARSSGLLPPAPERRHDSGHPSSVEDFIVENRIDENAARALRMEPADVQQNVMERGSLVDCFNASAAVMGRIRDIKQRGGNTSSSGASAKLSASGLPLPTREQVEDFIRDNTMDPNAARALRTENPEVQAEVLERGSLKDCINASAAVMGRIRDGKMKKEAARKSSSASNFSILNSSTSAASGAASALPSGPRMSPVTSQEVEQFIVDNRLDDSAARALMSVSPDIQANVMDRGSLAVTMNPSSAVMGRIRDAKTASNSSRSFTGGGCGGCGGGGFLDPGTSSLFNYGAAMGAMGFGEVLRSSPY